MKSLRINNPWVQDIMHIAAGILIAGFGLHGFLVPNNFLDGGVTGIALLIHAIYHVDLSLLVILANLPFIVLAAYHVNIKFALKTLASIIALAICLLIIPYPIVTSDKLLTSIFGGFFMGLGVGLAIRGGCSLDGIEVLALYAWKRTGFTISEIILAMNSIIFGIAALKFGIETSLFSMLTYFVATRTIDYVVEGLEEYTGVTIISGMSEQIKEKLVKDLGRGITIYKGERGYLKDSYEIHQPCDIIFTIVTRLDVRRLNNLVIRIDPKAFIFTNSIKEAAGGVLKRRKMH